MLSDLLEAFEEDNKKPYFLGTIVTCDTGSQFELIDGQQRLTTFFLMLCAVKHLYKTAGESTDLIENLIYSPTMDPNGDTIHSYHLQLQYEDAGNCLELIESGGSRPKDLALSGERLFDAFKIITDFLSEKFSDLPQLKKFVYFLLMVTSFIRIETHDITDALKIFETINQRGKGLDSMDLLKNMVFCQVDRNKFKELNMNWKEITRALESIEEKPLRFLRYFIMASAPSDQFLNYSWIEFRQLNSSIFGSELPVNFNTFRIAITCPSTNLLFETFQIRKRFSQSLAAHDANLYLSHV